MPLSNHSFSKCMGRPRWYGDVRGSHRMPGLTVKRDVAFQVSCMYRPTEFCRTFDKIALPWTKLDAFPSRKSDNPIPVKCPSKLGLGNTEEPTLPLSI